MASYDKDCFPGGSIIRAINKLPGEGKEGERKDKRGSDVVSHSVSNNTRIKLSCSHSRIACSAPGMPKEKDPSNTGGNTFSSSFLQSGAETNEIIY